MLVLNLTLRKKKINVTVVDKNSWFLNQEENPLLHGHLYRRVSYLFLGFIKYILCAIVEHLLKWINGSLDAHPPSVCAVKVLNLSKSVQLYLQYFSSEDSGEL